MFHRLLMIFILSVFVVSLVGCETMGTSEEGASGGDGQAQYEQIAKEADALYKQALGMGNVWRDTEEKLGDASKAAKSGDYAKAVALATEAKEESQMAIEQAKSQKNAGPTLF